MGIWTVSSGAGAVLADSSNATTNFTGLAGVNYTLEWTIGTSAACSTSNDFATISFMKSPSSQICYATVDTAYGGDTVVKIFWQKPIESYVAGYVIYREKAGQGFVPVATVSNALFSSYADSSARPTQQAERYKIATIDSCGNSTDVPSALAHQTILLQGSIDVTGSLVNLDWDAYIGINDPTRYYTVIRDNLGNGVWDSIAATPWSITAANIGNANLYPNANYAVDLVWQGTCTPSQRMMSGFNKTRSNIKNRNALPVGITKNVSSKAISIYPNPAKNEVTISGLSAAVKEIELYNLLGEKCFAPVYSKREGDRVIIDVSKIASGVYTIQIKTIDFIEMRKLVIER